MVKKDRGFTLEDFSIQKPFRGFTKMKDLDAKTGADTHCVRTRQSVKKLSKRPRFLYNNGNGGVFCGRMEKECTERTGNNGSGYIGASRSSSAKNRKSNGL